MSFLPPLRFQHGRLTPCKTIADNGFFATTASLGWFVTHGHGDPELNPMKFMMAMVPRLHSLSHILPFLLIRDFFTQYEQGISPPRSVSIKLPPLL
jgi:hypothetical protein